MSNIDANHERAKYTALHFAVTHGSIQNTRILLEKGANINALTIRNETPLIMATEKGYLELVELLVAKGADLHLPNNDILKWPIFVSCTVKVPRIFELLLNTIDSKKFNFSEHAAQLMSIAVACANTQVMGIISSIQKSAKPN